MSASRSNLRAPVHHQCSNIKVVLVAMVNVTVAMKDIVALTLSIDGASEEKIKSRTYSIPTELVMEVKGAKYLCLSRKEVCVRRLLTMQARAHVNTGHSNEGITNLSLTDIPDQLITLRQDALKLALAGTQDKASKLSKRFLHNKKSQDKLVKIGDVITITTPHVHGIDPVAMNVMTNYHGPIWVEITNENMSWITKAVGAQVPDGSHKSKRARCLEDAENADDAVGAESSDDAGGDASGFVEAMAVHPSQDVKDVLPPMPKRSPSPPKKGRTGTPMDYGIRR